MRWRLRWLRRHLERAEAAERRQQTETREARQSTEVAEERMLDAQALNRRISAVEASTAEIGQHNGFAALVEAEFARRRPQ